MPAQTLSGWWLREWNYKFIVVCPEASSISSAETADFNFATILAQLR
jgi:hypothetical protein